MRQYTWKSRGNKTKSDSNYYVEFYIGTKLTDFRMVKFAIFASLYLVQNQINLHIDGNDSDEFQ